jgi:hypothetical protein
MTGEQFVAQMSRLRMRFGDKAFDPAFVDLVWREVHDMSVPAFSRFVDVAIGSRPHTKPPLLTDFREARLAESKRKFEDDLRGATDTLKRRAPEEMRKHLRLILSKEFGGVESVGDALEIAKLKRRVSGPEGEGA